MVAPNGSHSASNSVSAGSRLAADLESAAGIAAAAVSLALARGS